MNVHRLLFLRMGAIYSDTSCACVSAFQGVPSWVVKCNEINNRKYLIQFINDSAFGAPCGNSQNKWWEIPRENSGYIDEHCAMLSFGVPFMVTSTWHRRHLLVSIHHMYCRSPDPENPLHSLHACVGFLSISVCSSWCSIAVDYKFLGILRVK